jgi:hypothetical protein
MKRDERNSSGEEGDGNPRAQNRQASEEAVRKLQFETARRILFSTKIVPGSNPPREWWTSAGFLRYDDLQFEEEFQLGPYTLKVTEGSRQDNLLFAAPVWLQMTGSIGSWYNSDMGMRPHNTDRDIIVAGGQWVCIGILKSDTFVSIVPNFLNLSAVQLFSIDSEDLDRDAENDIPPNREYFYPEPEKRYDYLETFAEGSISGGYTATIDEDSVYQRIKDDNPELDSDNEEDKEKLDELVEDDTTFELFNGNVNVDWVQLQPGLHDPVYVFQRQPPLYEEERDGQEDRGDIYKTADGGQVKTYIDQSGEGYWVRYNGPIPFDLLVPYLEHRVPEQFLSSFLSPSVSPVPIDRAKAIFSFNGYNFAWTKNIQETVWHAADIAAVSFVQSYLVYILSGPDKRRFLPDSTDKSPMKETQLPPCLLKLRPRAKAPTQLALVVDANNGREVVSGSVYFRFFFETLASRAYSASLKAMGLSKLRKDSQAGIPEFIDKFSKFMAGTFDTEALTGIFAALDAVKERSERTEFLSAELVGKPVGVGLRRGKFGKGRSPSPRFRRSGPSVGRGGIPRRRKDGPGTLAMGRRATRKGYTSRKTFVIRPGVQHKWGHGLGFGGYRWGYWNRRRFPWVYAYSSWYPWWFFLDPVFYAEKRAYVDPESKWAWGIPPAGPGEWGPVAPPSAAGKPTAGTDNPTGKVRGYSEPPASPEGEQLSVDLPPESQEIGTEAEDIGRSIPDTLKAKYAKSKKVADLKNRPLGELVEYLVELVDEASAQRGGGRIAGDEVALANNLSNHLRSRGATRAKFPKLGKAQDALVKLTSTRLAARQGKRATGRQHASQARRAAQDVIDQGGDDQVPEDGGGRDQQQQEIEARAPRDENDDGDGTAPRPKKKSGGRSGAPAKIVYMKNLSKRQKLAWDKVWFARKRLATARQFVSNFKAIGDGKDYEYKTLAQRRQEVDEAQKDLKRQETLWYSTGMKVDIDDVVDTKGIDSDIVAASSEKQADEIGQELSETANLIASQLLMTRIGKTRRY